MRVLLEDMSQRYADRIIVFDSPPLMLTTEARVLATQMGQVVMVVQADKTLQADVQQALSTIEACPVKMMLLNRVRTRQQERLRLRLWLWLRAQGAGRLRLARLLTPLPVACMIPSPTPRRWHGRPVTPVAMSIGVMLWSAAAGVLAQGIDPEQAAASRRFFIVPSVGLSLQATDNVNLSATNKQADLIAQVSPGLTIGGRTGRVRGFLDYTLTASAYARSADMSNFQNFLDARVDAEIIDDRVFIDANATISQQTISPFGQQSPDPALGNPNRTEVATLNVAPYIKGQIASQVDYLGRAFYTYTDSGSSLASNSSMYGGLLALNSSTRWSKLTWGLDFSYREVNFEDGGSNYDQLNILSLNYAVTPYLIVSARGNVETSDLVTIDKETTSGYGWGVRWNPSPRTLLVLEQDQRVFGSSHTYSFEYRTPRTVWSLSVARRGCQPARILKIRATTSVRRMTCCSPNSVRSSPTPWHAPSL